MAGFASKLKQKYDDMPANKRKLVVLALIVGFGGFALMVGYGDRGKNAGVVPKVPSSSRPISLDPDMLERDAYREAQTGLTEMAKKQAQLEKELERLKAGGGMQQAAPMPLPAPPVASQGAEEIKIPTSQELLAKNPVPMPNPAPTTRSGLPLPPGHVPSEATAPPPGNEKSIAVSTHYKPHGEDVAAKKAAESKKKDEKNTVYLPPGLMEAELLTGFDASTSSKGSKDPEPMVIRIQAPAILPSGVKADLKGCFLIGEARGSLSRERAMCRLINLSCIDVEGNALIDQPVKGFVVDSDGKVGLSGRVVAKFGTTVARAAMAGVFGGVGEALQSSTTTQSVSPLGTTQIVDSSQLAKSSVGGGLKEGANTLRDFYLTLAENTVPVIEISPTKKLTAVISEGVELEIRNVKRLGGPK